MPRRTKEDAEQTRKKILKAALHIFSKKGYSKSTFVDIAQRIKLTKGAVYWHFQTKQDLLVELMNTMFDKERALVQKEVPELSTLDDLRNYFVIRTRIILEEKDCRKFMYFIFMQMEWTTNTLAFTQNKLKQLKHGPFEEIDEVLSQAQEEGLLRKDVDVRLTRDILIGLFKGLVKDHLSGFADSDLISCIDKGFQAVLESIKTSKIPKK